MKLHVIEIFLLLEFYTSNGIPRFHHHNPLKKHSSHTRAKSSAIKPQTDLCSGSTKQDATLIKQFYARTFTLFRNEKPGCVCIQLCKGKPAYCYPKGCFHSLGGCNGKTTIPTPTDKSKKAGSKVHERESESDSEAIQSRNSLSTQGDFNKKFQSKANNKQTGDQVKKRENDSFLTEDKDKEIPDVLVENYPSDLKILKLIDKDYTQWPKSKRLQDMPYVNFTKWDLGELNVDEISTASNIASSNTTNVPYALFDVGRQVPSFIDFKQQFEMLSNSQQMSVFDDFFAETKKVIISNNPTAGTTLSGMHHQNVRESNDFSQKEEYATKEDILKKIATSESKDDHLENYAPNKRDFTDESGKELYTSENFSELYNNYVKRFDEPKIRDDIGSTKENDSPALSSAMYKPQYLKPTPTKISKTLNSNHKPIEDATIDDRLYTQEFQDIANKPTSANGKISETDFNAIFHNYYGENQTDQQIKIIFFISNNSYLSTPSTDLESTIDKNDDLLNKTGPIDRILGTDEVMNSGKIAHSATHQLTPNHKPKFSHRGIVLKSDSSRYKGGRNMTSNHKGTSNFSQVRFTNDYAQLKNRDVRPTSQIYATVEKRPLQSKYQKERRSQQESKRHILSSTELSIQLTEIVTLVNNITSQPRNETTNKRRSNPYSRHFRRKRPGVPKSK